MVVQLRCNTLLKRFFPFQKISISQKSRLVGDQNIAILTLKSGLLSVFFTEKRYKSINIGYISNNISYTIPLRVCLISELRSPPQITILISVPKGIQNLLTIPNSRLLLSLSPFLLLLVLLAGSVFSQDPSELSANQLTLPD